MGDQEPNFEFVKEKRLREVLEDYWSQAINANSHHLYLATLVACGAVAEGLLT